MHELSASVLSLEERDKEYQAQLSDHNSRLGESDFVKNYAFQTSLRLRSCQTFSKQKPRNFIDVLRLRGKNESRGCFTGSLKQVQQRTQQMLRLLAYSKRDLLSSLKSERQHEYKKALNSLRRNLQWKETAGKLSGAIIVGCFGIWVTATVNKVTDKSSSLWDSEHWAIVASAIAGAKVGQEFAMHMTEGNLTKAVRNERLAYALFEEMLVQDAFDSMAYSDLKYLPDDKLFTEGWGFENRNCPVTQEPILHAVKVPCCKQLMERAKIRFWLHKKNLDAEPSTCPLCCTEIDVKELKSQTLENVAFFNSLVKRIGEWETLLSFAQAEQGLANPGIHRVPHWGDVIKLSNANSEIRRQQLKKIVDGSKAVFGEEFAKHDPELAAQIEQLERRCAQRITVHKFQQLRDRVGNSLRNRREENVSTNPDIKVENSNNFARDSTKNKRSSNTTSHITRNSADRKSASSEKANTNVPTTEPANDNNTESK